MVFCTECGTQLTGAFCSQCGAKASGGDASSSAPPTAGTTGGSICAGCSMRFSCRLWFNSFYNLGQPVAGRAVL